VRRAPRPIRRSAEAPAAKEGVNPTLPVRHSEERGIKVRIRLAESSFLSGM
jgi:hypothetical protein